MPVFFWFGWCLGFWLVEIVFLPEIASNPTSLNAMSFPLPSMSLVTSVPVEETVRPPVENHTLAPENVMSIGLRKENSQKEKLPNGAVMVQLLQTFILGTARK